MNFTVLLEASAARDIALAFDWYETRRTGLGADFMRAITVGRDALSRDPQKFPVTVAPFRWYKLRRFPYALHYRIRKDKVLVAACLHFRQSPTHWPGA